MTTDDSSITASQEPTNAPGRAEIPVEGRAGADVASGSNAFISWGVRSDVGLVRSHNEDSFLLRTPLFAVCDGMGGHAAGEVASSIAVETIGEKAPANADDTLLGAAVESANLAIIEGASTGKGKVGMGCTASVVLIEGSKMAVAHVGDSRVYLLRHGTLVRVTHDHSYVEELVDSGQITADEARVHPSRSVITRALGSDPDMYADHFSLEVNDEDRIIVCSDGLSSMITDADIEALSVSSVTPQQAADNLVSAALTAGGADNVTVIVVDILNDGVADTVRQHAIKRFAVVIGLIVATFVVVGACFYAFIRSEWYLGVNGDTVGIYQGVTGSFMGIELSELVETTSVEVSDLPGSVQEQLVGGIRVNSESQASETVKAYRQQITDEKTKAAETADEVRNGDASASEATGSTSPDSPTTGATPSPEASATEGGE